MTQKLVKRVAADIESYFERMGVELGFNIMFSNEMQMKMQLLHFLKKEGMEHNYCLLPEYRVPTDRLKGNYPWHNRYGVPQDMYIDLVAYDDENEYVPIEIKYRTRSVESKDMLVFGQPEKGINLLCDQGAQNLGMYGFWKDVRRIELIHETFHNVENGIVLFLTNDPVYCTRKEGAVDKNVNYYAFRMTEGRKVNGDEMKWKREDSDMAAKNPGFKLNGKYTVKWTDVEAHSTPRSRRDFSYCMLIV